MFVEELSLREFRGVRECAEPLRFSKFNVLVGRNNAGKTTVLEALALLPLPIGDHELPVYGVRRGQFLADMHGGPPSLIYGYSGTAVLRYRIDGNEWVVELTDMGGIELTINGERVTSVEDVGRALDVRADPGLLSKIVNEMVFFIPNDTTALSKLHEALKSEHYRYLVMKSGANVRIARELVNECVDDVYTEVMLDSPELRARKELPDGRVFYIKLRDLGDGVEKAILTTLWLEATKPSLVLWDDFETSTHPSLIRGLLRWLSQRDWQVVLATHSMDVLYGLVEVWPDDAQVLLLCKGAGDVLKARQMGLDELEDLLEAGQDPRYVVELLKL